MNRNLSRRIEVAYPIYEPRYRKRLMDFMTLYMTDNTKSRVIDAKHQNRFVKRGKGEEKRNAQTLVWEYYRSGSSTPSCIRTSSRGNRHGAIGKSRDKPPAKNFIK